MDTAHLFTAALNLEKPWTVSKVNFIPSADNPNLMELHIWLSYPDNSKFICPSDGCTELCPQHDREERVWRHLNFFQHLTFIHTKLPRVRCKNHGVSTIDVPWARKGSGITLLF